MIKIQTLIFVFSALVILMLVAISGCSGSTTTTATPSGSVTTPSTQIDLTAQDSAFDKSVITVPAGAQITINFVNKDVWGHNFAAYTDEAAATPIFIGQIIRSSSISYTFTAPATPGTYFFRCDPHARIMKGQLIVQ